MDLLNIKFQIQDSNEQMLLTQTLDLKIKIDSLQILHGIKNIISIMLDNGKKKDLTDQSQKTLTVKVINMMFN